jgi:hypothetical protein
MISSDRLKEILGNNNYLQGQRGNWDSYYQDCADFALPRKAWITSIRINGEQLKFNFLYSVRAIRDVKKSAAGFQAQLTNPSSKWFGFQPLDTKLRGSGRIQKYFKECEDIQMAVMGQSNFYNMDIENYVDHLVFGIGNMMTEEDPKTHVRYTEIPVEQYNIEEDERGRVCGVYRNSRYTAGQLTSWFGDSCSKGIKDAMKDDKPYQVFEILHYVSERYRRDVAKKDKYNKPWESVWIVKKEEHKLEEGGFEENPYAVSRFWKDANDPRGFSPTMDVLASIKLANAQKRTNIRMAMKKSDPALMMPDRGWLAAPNLNPGYINYYNKKHTNPDDFRAIENKGDFSLSVEAMEMENTEIDQAYYIPMFETLGNITKKMSIPEVQRRIAENLQFVGPTIGRLLDEGKTPPLIRTFNILERLDVFPPRPRELIGQKLDIIYLSPLAKAQRQSEMNGIQSWLSMIAEIAQFKPEAIDIPNVDKIIVSAGELQGVDPEFANEKDVIADIRNKRAKAQQMAAQLQASEVAAGAAEKGAMAKRHLAEASKG